MHYLRDGYGSPGLAKAFALIAGIGALTTTPFTQPNSIAIVFDSVFGVPTWLAGLIIAVLVWAVIIRGIKSIGRVAEKLSPLKVGSVSRWRPHRHRDVRPPAAATCCRWCSAKR